MTKCVVCFNANGILWLNSLPARVRFCCLLITFANNLAPDQHRQNAGPDHDPNCLTHGIPERNFSQKVEFEKKTNQQTSKFPSMQGINNP